ncbi:hypothetical protein, partial [Microbacterium sp. P5_E9]
MTAKTGDADACSTESGHRHPATPGCRSKEESRAAPGVTKTFSRDNPVVNSASLRLATRYRRTCVSSAALALLAIAAPVHAMEIDTGNPDVVLRWDNT